MIPREPTFDDTLALLADPYRYIGSRCTRLGSDLFETRLMLRRAVCISGAEAAREFYAPGRFTRRGAMPQTALTLLQDRGSVATLDGEAHRARKAMFMGLMTPARLAALGEAFDEEWRAELPAWSRRGRVVVRGDVPLVLTRAICRWAGVPLASGDAPQRARELVAMYEGAAAVGPRNWRGQVLRMSTERWLRSLVSRVRGGALRPPADSALHVIATHRDADGTQPSVRHAAVEVVNILRPTVATERYITFAAHALVTHPAARARIAAGDDEYLGWFVAEVRRFYPFFPMVGGRVLEPFTWRGYDFTAGRWVVLDIHGTNHDGRRWREPDQFAPERFSNDHPSPFDMIPQGGGDHLVNHRCAGEWITIELVRRAVRMLTRELTYDVPKQDLSIDMQRMPAVPRSGVVLERVAQA